jgi:hypothetical protein
MTDRQVTGAGPMPEALRVLAEARGIPVDDALLETIAPMVGDLFDMASELRAWSARREADGPRPAAPAGAAE